MVQTIKFSEFADADLNLVQNQLVGFGDGVNIREPVRVAWTTATRPATPYDGLLGYNTDLTNYEYWDNTLLEWVTIATTISPSNLNWNLITSLSATMDAQNGYVTNNAGQVVLTLPSAIDFGEIMAISGLGSGGWKLIFNAGQNAILGNTVSTTTTGSLASTNQFDQIELLCVVENTTFTVRNVIGNITII